MAPKERLSRSAEPGLLTPAQFLALPPQPDGTVVRVQIDAAAGVNARLRLRKFQADGVTPNPSAYQWEFDGGGQLTVDRFATDTYSAAATWNLSPNEPGIVLPLAGDFEAEYEASMSGAAGSWAPGIAVNGAVGATVTAPSLTIAASTWYAARSSGKLAGVAAGATVKGAMSVFPAMGINVDERRLRVRPVRVQGPAAL